ncbi:MAG: hypothetical protein M3O82_10475 [Verrucomicrobiota bacterium]|nr:hypothetical protein [Verrucomicrobiota bacterium]
MTPNNSRQLSKVPEVTATFWIIKIVATTLGEIGGNAASMSLHLGYVVSTAIFAVIFIGAVVAQVKAARFQPALYWLTITVTTILGTTTADLVTRDLGIGYTGGSLILLAGVLGSLALWRWTTGTVSVESVATPTVEAFYWITIMWSQTLGTALGDWFADTAGLGYLWSSLIFAAALLLIYLLYRATSMSRVALFWAAFIITRPFGAVFGNLFDKPPASGGLGVNRFVASALLIVLMAAMIWIFPQRAARSNERAGNFS